MRRCRTKSFQLEREQQLESAAKFLARLQPRVSRRRESSGAGAGAVSQKSWRAGGQRWSKNRIAA